MFLEVESNEPTTWMGSKYYDTMKAMDCKKEGKSVPLVLHATCFLVFSPPICHHRRPPVVRSVWRRAAEMCRHGLGIPKERPDPKRSVHPRGIGDRLLEQNQGRLLIKSSSPAAVLRQQSKNL